MSRSKPSIFDNPVKRRFQWAGSDGLVQWYDKEAETDNNVSLPFRFLYLDSLTCITGYDQHSKVGIFSNKVRDFSTNPLLVKTYGGTTIAEGLYTDIKQEVTNVGGKFTQSVYLAYKGEDNQLQIGTLRVCGSALGPWFNFTKKVGPDLESEAIHMARGEQDSQGTVEFYRPTYTLQDVSQDSSEQAYMLDETLQEYLEKYLDAKGIDASDKIGDKKGEAISGEPSEDDLDVQLSSDEELPDLDDIDSDLPF